MAKSNISVCCSSLEAGNRIYGDVKNPWDKSKTSGGSTGGEAALISSKCSLLGIGNDDGGSLRIPAAFTGIYTFMPTHTRATNYGIFDGNKIIYRNGMITTGGSIGPMARNTEDLKLIIENVFGKFSDIDFYTNN